MTLNLKKLCKAKKEVLLPSGEVVQLKDNKIRLNATINAFKLHGHLKSSTHIGDDNRQVNINSPSQDSSDSTLTDRDWFTGFENHVLAGGLPGHSLISAISQAQNPPEVHNLDPGRHDIKIKIKSGHLSWDSRLYTIHVPPRRASNSHFAVVMK